MSAAPTVSRAEDEAVRRLRSLLAELGYPQLYHQAVAPELFSTDHARSLQVVGALDEPERSLLLLLGLGVPVERPRVASGGAGELGAVMDALCAAGLAAERAGAVRTTGWVVVPALRGLLMTGTPPTYDRSALVGAPAYVGFESLRLAAVLPPARGRRVLDLGAGCGVQGLLAASGASEAVLTDVDERSLQLSQLNARLNEVAHPVSVRAGPLYEPVAGERFDLITCLPPYLPTVPGSAISPSAAGGADGLGVIRGMVQGAADRLHADGELVALCQLLCDDEGPLVAGDLEALAGDLEARLVLNEWHPLQPYVVELATRLAVHHGGGERRQRELAARYSESLRALGATGVCTAVLRLRRRVPAEGPRVRLVGRVPEATPGSVPVPAASLTFEAPHDVTAVSAASGASGLVDGPTASLLRAVDGERSVAEVAALAWGGLPEHARPDLLDQAVHRLAQAARQGLVELEPCVERDGR